MMAHKDTDVVVEVLIEEVAKHRMLSNSGDTMELQVSIRKNPNALAAFTTFAKELQAIFPPTDDKDLKESLRQALTAYVGNNIDNIKAVRVNADGSETELTEASPEAVEEVEAEPAA